MIEPPGPRRSGPTTLLSNRVVDVIDDDASLLTLTTSYLSRAGAVMPCAGNGGEAMALLQPLRADGVEINAVPCDVRRRGGSGIELHARVGELLPDIAPA